MRISYILFLVACDGSTLSSAIVSYLSRKANEVGSRMKSMLSKRSPVTRGGKEALLFIGFDPETVIPKFNLPRKHLIEGNAWGECEIVDDTVSVYPSDIGEASWQAVMDSRSIALVPSKGLVVHRENDQIHLPTADKLFNEGKNLIKWETLACQHGWLDIGLESLSGSCHKSQDVESDASTSELLKCLYSKQSLLSNIDRKIADDADQVSKDMPRYKNVPPSVTRACEEISLVWLTRVVPWFSFSQGSSESCFYLVRKRKDVPHDIVLSELIRFTDEITRVSRYSRDRVDEYSHLLALYWGKALDRHFTEPFRDVLGEYFHGNLVLFLMRPAISEALSYDQSGLVYQFLFTNGRPGLWAYYVAAVEHGSKCFKSKPRDESQSARYNGQILQQPMLFWCRKGEDVSKVLDRANRILSTPIYDSGPKSTISNFVRRNVPGVRFDGEISFAQLVSMIDIAVEDMMAHTAPRSPQIKPPQSLSTMDSRKEIDEVETVDFSPHMTLSELVDVHEPFKPVVNNVVRDLGPKFTTMEYSTMVDSVLKIKSMCLKGELFQIQLTNGVDLHGTKRGIPQEHFVSPDFLKHELFLTPLLSCLFENYSRLDSIMSGYLWALSQIRNFMIEARNGDEGEQQSVDTDCEEILSVYAIVYANSADAIMNGEPIGWCRSLRGLTNAEGARLLSSLEILKAIAVIGNKTVGMTRFGPSNASEYTRTFSQYLAEALHVLNADEVGALEINQDDGTGTVTVAEMISSFGREERLSEGVWTYLLNHGQAGLVCLVQARLRLGSDFISWNNLVDHRPGLLNCQSLKFKAMVKAMFLRVDRHMSEHLSSIGSQL